MVGYLLGIPFSEYPVEAKRAYVRGDLGPAADFACKIEQEKSKAMANEISADIHVGTSTDHDLAMNILQAGLALAHEWEKQHAGRRYGVNTQLTDKGILKVTLVGWQNG